MKLAVLTTWASATVGDCSLVARRYASTQKALTLSGVRDRPRNESSLLNHASTEIHPAPAQNESELPFFGDTACPCIGFDNVAGGETTVTFGDHKVAYPADLGSRCEAWDNGVNPTSCLEGQKPGEGKGWCAQQWCYVDPCQCKIDVLPKISTYVPEALYRGKPLFFSYATCGGKDEFTEKVPEVGTPGCRCIGFDNMPGTLEVGLEDGRKVMYPAEIGGSCSAWDKATHPDCKGENPPDWCSANWCYVDPCSCTNEDPKVVPKISSYMPNSTFTGKSLYFSYETCNSKDTWTEKNHPHACVNQDTKEKCDMENRCTWTEGRCLGTELVDHPLCKGVAEDMVEKISKLEKEMEIKLPKSGAAQVTTRASLAMAAAAAAVASVASLGSVL